jgi:hypothetical protein
MEISAGSQLGSIGSDLSITVSFVVASELLELAKSGGIAEDELVMSVLALSIVLRSIPRAWAKMGELKLLPPAIADSQSNGIVEFVHTLVEVCIRISTSLSIQLLGNNVRARSELRSIRILTLLSLVRGEILPTHRMTVIFRSGSIHVPKNRRSSFW